MKLTHGSDLIANGNLKGATDRGDYFYFFCPTCPDNWALRIVRPDKLKEEPGNRYNDDCKSKAQSTFIFGFELFCEKCGHRDYVKLSNGGWQGGKHSEILGKFDMEEATA